MKLEEAGGPIRKALERLAESPRALRCFVVIENLLTKRFVQFCTPPPPSPFGGPPLTHAPGPLIYDGTGNGKPGGYEPVQVSCDVDYGVEIALGVLVKYLLPEAELRIVEESTRMGRPS
jgi:hypothetical protein